MCDFILAEDVAVSFLGGHLRPIEIYCFRTKTSTEHRHKENLNLSQHCKITTS